MRAGFLFRRRLNGYLALQGNKHVGTARLKHFLEVLARERLGTRWAKYPFSRCRICQSRRSQARGGGSVGAQSRQDRSLTCVSPDTCESRGLFCGRRAHGAACGVKRPEQSLPALARNASKKFCPGDVGGSGVCKGAGGTGTGVCEGRHRVLVGRGRRWVLSGSQVHGGSTGMRRGSQQMSWIVRVTEVW